MNSIDLRDGISPFSPLQSENDSQSTGFIDASVPPLLEFESPIKVVGKTTNLTPVEHSDQVNILTDEQRDVVNRIATAKVRTVLDWEQRQIQFLPDHTVVMDYNIVANVVAESMGITQGDVVYEEPVVPAQHALNKAVADRDRFWGKHNVTRLTKKQGWRAERLDKAVNEAEVALTAAQARREKIASGALPWWDHESGVNDFDNGLDYEARNRHPAPQIGERRADHDLNKPVESDTTVVLTNGGVVGSLLELIARDQKVSRKKKLLLCSLVASIVLDACAPVASGNTVPAPTKRPEESAPGVVNGGYPYDLEKHRQFGNFNINDDGCKKTEQFFIDMATKSQGALTQFDTLADVALKAYEKSGSSADIGSIYCELSKDGKDVLVYYKTRDGKKILIPTNEGFLVPGKLTDTGGLEVFSPPMTPPAPNVDRRVNIPPVVPAAGGAVPEILREDVTRDEANFRAALAAGGIDVSKIVIRYSQRVNGPFEWMHWAEAADDSFIVMPRLNNDQLARPDFRVTTGDVKFKEWIIIKKPPGISGNIIAGFIDGIVLPQVLIVDTTPDANGKLKVLAVLDQVMSKWVKTDGSALATPTPPPSPTPAEVVPTSCLDVNAEQKVIDKAVKAGGFKDLLSMMDKFVDNYGLRSKLQQASFAGLGWVTANREKIPFRVNVENALVLGYFQAPIDGGHVNCLTYAYPVMINGVLQARVATVYTDATKYGIWSNIYVRPPGGRGMVSFENEAAYIAWLKNKIGKSLLIGTEIYVTADSLDKAFEFKDAPGFSRKIIGDIARASYLEKFRDDPDLLLKLTGFTKPDPSQLEEGLRKLNNGQLGLYSGTIFEIAEKK